MPHGYGALYLNIARYPELGLFRRFGPYWAKKLHDDTSNFLSCLEDLNRAIADISELGAISVLDCPLRFAKEKIVGKDSRFEKLFSKWEKYDEALLKYGMWFERRLDLS
jgi:hypothetical protein